MHDAVCRAADHVEEAWLVPRADHRRKQAEPCYCHDTSHEQEALWSLENVTSGDVFVTDSMNTYPLKCSVCGSKADLIKDAVYWILFNLTSTSLWSLSYDYHHIYNKYISLYNHVGYPCRLSKSLYRLKVKNPSLGSWHNFDMHLEHMCQTVSGPPSDFIRPAGSSECCKKFQLRGKISLKRYPNV